MLGVVVVMTAAGAALGAYQGGMISNSYFGEVDHFGIHKVHDGKKTRKHAVIFVNGFLSQKNRDVEDWTQHLGDHFDDDTWYHVDWESHNLHRLGMLLAKAPEKAGTEMAKELAKKAMKSAAKKIGPFAIASNIADVMGNPWRSTRSRQA